MEHFENKKAGDRDPDIVFSRAVSAGRRIYYLDVKKNRRGELFLTITESKKMVQNNPSLPAYFEKHKIFLYKEDFDNFHDAFNAVLCYAKENNDAADCDTGDRDKLQIPIDLRIDF
jgi:hypothetical protein